MTEHPINSKLIPSLISVVIAILTWMALNINRVSEALAVMVYKTDNHERRIEILEEFKRRGER